MINKQKQTAGKNGIGSLVSGITGAVIGVAVAGAAVVLNDNNTRKKVTSLLTNIKSQAMNYLEDVQKKTDKQEKETEEKLTN